MERFLRHSRNGLRLLVTALLGFALSWGLYQAWQLEPRWAVVVFLAVAAVSISMCLVRVFSDFLLIVTLFCLPFATLTKLFLPSGFEPSEGFAVVASGVFSVGVIDFLLLGLYMTWFYRVFVRKEQPPPRLILLDWLILFFILAHLLSAIGSYSVEASLGSTEFLLKHALVYFYLSRHVEERHLPWILAAFGFTIVLEAGLGSFQFATGRLVGLAYDKGAGGVNLNVQYRVPGIVSYDRATGTSYDSHTLGEFVGAVLPFALVLLFTPRLRPALKLGSLAAFAGALLVVILSLSRTGWISSAVALTIGVVLMVGLWRERQVVPVLAGVVILAAMVAPLLIPFIYERFANSPIETVTLRFLLFRNAWEVFTLHPVFGVGPAHYIYAFRAYNPWGVPGGPVHNYLLQLAAEVGIFGLAAYFATLAVAAWQLFSLARRQRDIPARLALAALLGLITIVANDQFNAGYREPNVFLMFWLLISLSVALPRLPLGAGAVLMAPPRLRGRLAVAGGMASGAALSDGE